MRLRIFDETARLKYEKRDEWMGKEKGKGINWTVNS